MAAAGMPRRARPGCLPVMVDARSYPGSLAVFHTSRDDADGTARLDQQLRLLHSKSVASLKESDA